MPEDRINTLKALKEISAASKKNEVSPTEREREHIIERINSFEFGTYSGQNRYQIYCTHLAHLVDFLPSNYQGVLLRDAEILKKEWEAVTIVKGAEYEKLFSIIKNLILTTKKLQSENNAWSSISRPLLLKIEAMGKKYFRDFPNFPKI